MKWPLGNNRGDEETEEPADTEKKWIGYLENQKTPNDLLQSELLVWFVMLSLRIGRHIPTRHIPTLQSPLQTLAAIFKRNWNSDYKSLQISITQTTVSSESQTSTDSRPPGCNHANYSYFDS